MINPRALLLTFTQFLLHGGAKIQAGAAGISRTSANATGETEPSLSSPGHPFALQG